MSPKKRRQRKSSPSRIGGGGHLQTAMKEALDHLKSGRLPQAEAAYQEILRDSAGGRDAPGDPGPPVAGRILVDVHSNLGVTLQLLGKVDESIASYRCALEIDPDYMDAHNNLGAAYLRQGRLDEAAVSYARAVELDPAHSTAHANLGALYQKMGRYEEAIAACRRALELNSEIVDAHNSLGNGLQMLGHLDDAFASYHRALELNPNSVDSYSNLGAVLHKKGELDESVDVLRYALEFSPDHSGLHNNLGISLKGLEKLDEAVASYRRASRFFPISRTRTATSASLCTIRNATRRRSPRAGVRSKSIRTMPRRTAIWVILSKCGAISMRRLTRSAAR